VAVAVLMRALHFSQIPKFLDTKMELASNENEIWLGTQMNKKQEGFG
jgi:hypothetical protein